LAFVDDEIPNPTKGALVSGYASEVAGAVFDPSRARFDTIVDWLAAEDADGLTHAQIEQYLHAEGVPMLRQLMQDRFDLRALREARLSEVVGADGGPRGTAESGHQRQLTTRFGPVTVTRIAYRSRGRSNLHPADAVANLPVEPQSHGIRRLAALEAARGSYADAADAVERSTTVRIGKRQIEDLTARAAADVDAFYTAHTEVTSGEQGDAVVLQFDAKGIVMRPGSLREPTAKAASSRKLDTRLSRGEKRYRKPMAEVAAVYDLTPRPRTINDILPDTDTDTSDTGRPVVTGKWLHASVTDDAAAVIAAGFTEADRRDPDRKRDWVALVDGNTHQIQRIRAEAKARKITVPIIVDFIHVANICGRLPARSSTPTTQTAGTGSKPRRRKSCRAKPATWPPASAAAPPASATPAKNAKAPTPARPTWTTSVTSWTTRRS